MSVLISPAVARDVERIMRDYHRAVAAVLYGREAVSKEDWKRAVQLGLIDPKADPAKQAEGLHVYGALLAHLDQADAQARYGDTMASVLEEIQRNPVPQTATEAHAARASAVRGAQAIVGLGNKVGAELGTSLIEADRALDTRLRETIRDVTSARFGDDAAARRIQAQGLADGLPDDFFEGQFRSTIGRQVSDIGHATQDWTRDLHRIAQTEAHTAVQLGQTESWTEQEDARAAAAEVEPRPVRVFKLPRPGACRWCVLLHLSGDDPRIYNMSEVVGHGTNVGLRRADWNIVVGSTHPFCGCSMHRVPSILAMPRGWRSGASAPSVIGPGGRIVTE